MYRLRRFAKKLVRKHRDTRLAGTYTTLLIENAEWLSPGLWHPIGSDGRVWCHVEAEVPPILLRQGGKASPSGYHGSQELTGTDGQQTADNRNCSRSSIEIRGNQAAPATVAVMAKGPRTRLIALAPSRGLVTRCGDPDSFDIDYIELRIRLSRYFSSPGFAVSTSGHVLREEWCNGMLLEQLPVREQIRHLRDLLDAFAELTRSEAIGNLPSSWSNIGTQLADLKLPRSLLGLLEMPGVLETLTFAPTIPSHGDLTTRNIIVGREAQLVDFDDVCYAPFWIDLSKLLWRSLRQIEYGLLAQDVRIQHSLDEIWLSSGLGGRVRPQTSAIALLFPFSQAWIEATRLGQRAVSVPVLSRAYARRRSFPIQDRFNAIGEV